jgi:hypothetical protein
MIIVPTLIPVVIKGLAPANVLEIDDPATAVLLIMRRPAMLRNREASVRWFATCQVSLTRSPPKPITDETPMVTLPAYPPRRSRGAPHVFADELPLTALPAGFRAIAIAYYPLEIAFWRFEFFTDQRENPDATAEALGFPIRTPHLGCGLFRTPCRGSGA